MLVEKILQLDAYLSRPKRNQVTHPFLPDDERHLKTVTLRNNFNQ